MCYAVITKLPSPILPSRAELWIIFVAILCSQFHFKLELPLHPWWQSGSPEKSTLIFHKDTFLLLFFKEWFVKIIFQRSFSKSFLGIILFYVWFLYCFLIGCFKPKNIVPVCTYLLARIVWPHLCSTVVLSLGNAHFCLKSWS